MVKWSAYHATIMEPIGKGANVKGKNKDVEDRKIMESAKAALGRGADISAVHAILRKYGIDPAVLGSEGKLDVGQVEGATAIPVGKEGPDYEKLSKATKTPFTKIAIVAIAVLLTHKMVICATVSDNISSTGAVFLSVGVV